MYYTEGELGGEFVEPMGFYDMSSVTPENIISSMQAICEEHGIPAEFDESTVTYGGMASLGDSLAYGTKTSLFKMMNKKVFKAVRISHPNPPQQYCDQLYVIYEDGVRFFYVGASKAFKERNEYERAINGDNAGVSLKGKFRAFVGVAPDEEPYNLEMEWHATIYSVFEAIVNQG